VDKILGRPQAAVSFSNSAGRSSATTVVLKNHSSYVSFTTNSVTTVLSSFSLSAVSAALSQHSAAPPPNVRLAQTTKHPVKRNSDTG
jgi:hypothetical protein